jgi:hypothetical protein
MQMFWKIKSNTSWELREKTSIKKEDPISFLYAGPTLFINFPNNKHIASLYNRSIAYLAGMKMNHGKSVLHSLFKCIDFFHNAPVPRQLHDNGPFLIQTNFTHILFSTCKDNPFKSSLMGDNISLSIVNDVLSLNDTNTLGIIHY